MCCMVLQVVDYLKRLGVLRQSAQRGGGPTGNANPRAQMGDGSEVNLT